MKKILLLGGEGYIGSRLFLELKDEFNITKIDLGWFSTVEISQDINVVDISSYEVIVLLAGHSSVKMCESDIMSSYYNNVDNFLNLLNKINKGQKFIYASSSSVYGNTGDSVVSEDNLNFEPNNYYDLTKKIIDMYAQLSEIEYYGLRFGTVNGFSSIFRNDIMINSMVFNAKKDGYINLFIKDIKRPILGIKDLTNAVRTIINKGKFDLRGIYNLCSFNSTPEKIAQKISDILKVEIKEIDISEINKINNVKLQTNSYNFAINCDKFINNFNFKFEDTIESIVNEIVSNFDSMEKNNRINIKKYDRKI